ncbi:MAG: MarR family winged helix-turn-helix transcriptional regulator [Bacillota bacterium]|nr:MarR family winged helix-turn-helix transcriptional regulator [Bacillota bacterium]
MHNYEAVRRIMLATNKLDGVYYLFAKRHSVNENTLAFLYALSDGQLHSQKEISDEWIIPRTTINSIVKTMLAEGYIQFAPEQHTKEKNIVLTIKGQQYADDLFADIFKAEKKAIAGTLENFSPEFITALEDFGNRLFDELQNISREDQN